jgi:hypothetical protein
MPSDWMKMSKSFSSLVHGIGKSPRNDPKKRNTSDEFHVVNLHVPEKTQKSPEKSPPTIPEIIVKFCRSFLFFTKL